MMLVSVKCDGIIFCLMFFVSSAERGDIVCRLGWGTNVKLKLGI